MAREVWIQCRGGRQRIVCFLCLKTMVVNSERELRFPLVGTQQKPRPSWTSHRNAVLSNIQKRNGRRMPATVLLILMVGARGFEPPTSRSQTERTTRLCYAPKSRFQVSEKAEAF